MIPATRTEFHSMKTLLIGIVGFVLGAAMLAPGFAPAIA